MYAMNYQAHMQAKRNNNAIEVWQNLVCMPTSLVDIASHFTRKIHGPRRTYIPHIGTYFRRVPPPIARGSASPHSSPVNAASLRPPPPQAQGGGV